MAGRPRINSLHVSSSPNLSSLPSLIAVGCRDLVTSPRCLPGRDLHGPHRIPKVILFICSSCSSLREAVGSRFGKLISASYLSPPLLCRLIRPHHRGASSFAFAISSSRNRHHLPHPPPTVAR
jgi:hypothetical protein